MNPDQQSNLQQLVNKYLKAYLGDPEGARHLAKYTSLREQGRKNYERVRAIAAQNGDITDLVLTKLLPHGDSSGNREREAWIHVAPAITKDIRSWFEGAGWAQPGDWPAIARAIWLFVERSVEDPAGLATWCNEFDADPLTKGLQMGMLTPILNALRPDDYLLINNKSRRVINYFTGAKFTQSLTEYPAMNSAGRAFVEGDFAPLVQGHTEAAQARMGDAFDAFCHWLVGVEKIPLSRVRYWKVAPGANADRWSAWAQGGFAAIGWNDLGDLTNVDKQGFEDRVESARVEHPDWTLPGLMQVWRLRNMSVGDRIVANRGTSAVLGIGTVTGPYYYASEEDPLRHRVRVNWDIVGEWSASEPGWRRTLVELDEKKFGEILHLAEATLGPPGKPPPAPPRPPDDSLGKCTLQQFADESGFPISDIQSWDAKLRRKRQIVLQGPPGTGKTYIAQRLAKLLTSGTRGIVDLVQFHPSYAYEDFIQGIRPVASDGNIHFEVMPGRFLQFCARAAQRPTEPCVLIIDEINRANLSRVFGELMYLLEYRHGDIPLATSGTLFRVPGNVYLIGTMNTADRSIALVDHALRRRFSFIFIGPQYEVLERQLANFAVDSAGLVSALRQLNTAIGDRNYEIGTSFFLADGDALRRNLPMIWTSEIEPYLEEYFYDQPQKVDEFRWEKLRTGLLAAWDA